MIPFSIPAWRKRQIADKFRRKDRVISYAVRHMEAQMKEAVDFILFEYERTGQFAEPTLAGMNGVSDTFYKKVIENAFDAADEEKRAQTGKKRLASKGPVGIPRTLRELEQVFRDKRQWSAIMKRSKKLTDKLRKAYLQKLRRKFKELLPRLEQGEITVDEAKNGMMESWSASKSRVETIFRTETTNYFAKAQTAFFDGDEDIIGFLFDSIADKARTDICKSRHGLIYRPGSELLKKNTPALHWNCRSHLLALANIPYNRKLIKESNRDPEKRSVAPIPPEWRK